MNKEIFLTNGIFSAIVTTATAFLGGWSLALQLLILLMIVDYITGLMSAFLSRTLSSRTGFIGLFKKIVMLMLIGVCAQVDVTLGTDFLRNVIVFFYISNEGISVLENTAKIGVPYPIQLKDALIQLGKMASDTSKKKK